MRILMLTRYSRKGASSRLRSYQFVDMLNDNGIETDIEPLFDDACLAAVYRNESLPLHKRLAPLFSRAKRLLRAAEHDLVWIEKEALPFVPWLIERLASSRMPPYIVDYDDALFHRYDQHANPLIRAGLGRKIDHVMARAACVIAGNSYLAARATRAGARRVEIIPTVLDPDRYGRQVTDASDRFRIGWIGTPVTAKYLQAIAPALSRAQRDLGADVVLVGSGPVELSGVKPTILDWSEETEAASIAGFSVGIMPLPDTPWERGKCGYKLIQYMASGIPVVASPVGANRDIVQDGQNGFLAGDTDDWFASFHRICNDPALASRLGEKGRADVCEKYSIEQAGRRIVRIVREVAP